MRFVPTLAALLLLFALFFGSDVFLPHGFAAQSAPATPTSGYVAYRVIISAGNVSEDLVLNETVRPTTGNGMVQVTLLLVRNVGRLEYSKVLNASSAPEVFPYLFGLNNQSLSYSTGGFDIDARIVHSGQANISFNGKAYQGENYSALITVTNSSVAGANYSFTGTIVTMPSSLVYSLNFHSNGQASLTVQLIATNLRLTSIQQSATNTLFGYALVGLGLLGAAAIAIPSLFAIVRVRLGKPKPATPTAPENQTQPPAKDKPEYWVD